MSDPIQNLLGEENPVDEALKALADVNLAPPTQEEVFPITQESVPEPAPVPTPQPASGPQENVLPGMQAPTTSLFDAPTQPDVTDNVTPALPAPIFGYRAPTADDLLVERVQKQLRDIEALQEQLRQSTLGLNRPSEPGRLTPGQANIQRSVEQSFGFTRRDWAGGFPIIDRGAIGNAIYYLATPFRLANGIVADAQLGLLRGRAAVAEGLQRLGIGDGISYGMQEALRRYDQAAAYESGADWPFKNVIPRSLPNISTSFAGNFISPMEGRTTSFQGTDFNNLNDNVFNNPWSNNFFGVNPLYILDAIPGVDLGMKPDVVPGADLEAYLNRGQTGYDFVQNAPRFLGGGGGQERVGLQGLNRPPLEVVVSLLDSTRVGLNNLALEMLSPADLAFEAVTAGLGKLYNVAEPLARQVSTSTSATIPPTPSAYSASPVPPEVDVWDTPLAPFSRLDDAPPEVISRVQRALPPAMWDEWDIPLAPFSPLGPPPARPAAQRLLMPDVWDRPLPPYSRLSDSPSTYSTQPRTRLLLAPERTPWDSPTPPFSRLESRPIPQDPADFYTYYKAQRPALPTSNITRTADDVAAAVDVEVLPPVNAGRVITPPPPRRRIAIEGAVIDVDARVIKQVVLDNVGPAGFVDDLAQSINYNAVDDIITGEILADPRALMPNGDVRPSRLLAPGVDRNLPTEAPITYLPTSGTVFTVPPRVVQPYKPTPINTAINTALDTEETLEAALNLRTVMDAGQWVPASVQRLRAFAETVGFAVADDVPPLQLYGQLRDQVAAEASKVGNMTVKDLKARLKALGAARYSKLLKADLVVRYSEELNKLGNFNPDAPPLKLYTADGVIARAIKEDAILDAQAAGLQSIREVSTEIGSPAQRLIGIQSWNIDGLNLSTLTEEAVDLVDNPVAQKAAKAKIASKAMQEDAADAARELNDQIVHENTKKLKQELIAVRSKTADVETKAKSSSMTDAAEASKPKAERKVSTDKTRYKVEDIVARFSDSLNDADKPLTHPIAIYREAETALAAIDDAVRKAVNPEELVEDVAEAKEIILEDAALATALSVGLDELIDQTTKAAVESKALELSNKLRIQLPDTQLADDIYDLAMSSVEQYKNRALGHVSTATADEAFVMGDEFSEPLDEFSETLDDLEEPEFTVKPQDLQTPKVSTDSEEIQALEAQLDKALDAGLWNKADYISAKIDALRAKEQGLWEAGPKVEGLGLYYEELPKDFWSLDSVQRIRANFFGSREEGLKFLKTLNKLPRSVAEALLKQVEEKNIIFATIESFKTEFPSMASRFDRMPNGVYFPSSMLKFKGGKRPVGGLLVSRNSPATMAHETLHMLFEHVFDTGEPALGNRSKLYHESAELVDRANNVIVPFFKAARRKLWYKQHKAYVTQELAKWQQVYEADPSALPRNIFHSLLGLTDPATKQGGTNDYVNSIAMVDALHEYLFGTKTPLDNVYEALYNIKHYKLADGTELVAAANRDAWLSLAFEEEFTNYMLMTYPGAIDAFLSNTPYKVPIVRFGDLYPDASVYRQPSRAAGQPGQPGSYPRSVQDLGDFDSTVREGGNELERSSTQSGGGLGHYSRLEENNEAYGRQLDSVITKTLYTAEEVNEALEVAAESELAMFELGELVQENLPAPSVSKETADTYGAWSAIPMTDLDKKAIDATVRPNMTELGTIVKSPIPTTAKARKALDKFYAPTELPTKVMDYTGERKQDNLETLIAYSVREDSPLYAIAQQSRKKNPEQFLETLLPAYEYSRGSDRIVNGLLKFGDLYTTQAYLEELYKLRRTMETPEEVMEAYAEFAADFTRRVHLIQPLDYALTQLPAYSQDVLYRGVMYGDLDKHYTVGRTILERGYLSTTKDPEVAKRFAGTYALNPFADDSPTSTTGWLLELRNTKGADITPVSHFELEQEVLIPRGASFVVTGVDETSRTIQLEQIASTSDLLFENKGYKIGPKPYLLDKAKYDKLADKYPRPQPATLPENILEAAYETDIEELYKGCAL